MRDEMINFKVQMTKIWDTRCRFSSCIMNRESCIRSHHALRITHYASRSERGLTLIEMMIALVVLLLVSLAMMQTALVSIDANMTNVLRDEAVGIAEMKMSEVRNTLFDNISAPSGYVDRNIRNVINFRYTISGTVTSAGTDAKQVDISVAWTWKGQNYTHTISTIVRRQ